VKIIEQIKEKAMLGMVMSMLGIGGTFLYNVGVDLWNLPSTVRGLKYTHTQDSIRAELYIKEIKDIKEQIKIHDTELINDYNDIKRIKKYLNL